MRILIIRHGLTNSNTRDYQSIFQHPNNEKKAQEMAKQIANSQSVEELQEDSFLNDIGNYEAELLGQYYGPILEEAARQNKLEVLVSPMHRTQATVAPLMKYLHEKTGQTAKIYGQYFEVGGLFDTQDSIFMDQLQIQIDLEQQYRKQGNATKANAIKKTRVKAWKSHTFNQVGLTMNQMKNMHQWIDGFMEMDVQDPNVPWHTSYSDWNDKYITQRMTRVADMLREKAKTVPADHIVVLVGHGETNKRVLFNLLGIDLEQVTSNIQNTSVAMVTITPQAKTMLNFFNRTAHLVQGPNGDSRNLTSYLFDHGLLMKKTKQEMNKEINVYPRNFEQHTQARSKTLYFIRHGQSQHNQCLEEKELTGDQVLEMYATQFHDSRLTKQGIQEAQQLSKILQQSKHLQVPELIVCSPLSRTMETAHQIFNFPTKDSKNSKNSTKINTILLEHIRERHGRFPCEKRRTVSEILKEYPTFDASRLTENDELWQWDRESREESIQRANMSLRWLWNRKEETIAVVSHAGFMGMSLFTDKNTNVIMKKNVDQPFENCEMRKVILTRSDVQGSEDMFTVELIETFQRPKLNTSKIEDEKQKMLSHRNMRQLYQFNKDEIESKLKVIRKKHSVQGPYRERVKEVASRL